MIDVIASQPHYRDHLDPVASLLPSGGDVALVAGYGDVVAAKRAGYRRIVLMQHGVGQSYGTDHPHYPGGARNDAVTLFLTPNEHSADRWRRAYPLAPAVAVGSPRLDTLPERVPGPGPVVAFAWHWDLGLYPETRSALPWFRDEMGEIAKEMTVIGTGHPRRRDLRRIYASLDIEYVPDFDDVCRRADVLVFDNTSVGYEFAATGRPVVVVDAPLYRPDVDFGIRFYDAADVGVRVGGPADLLPAIRRALEHRPEDIAAREEALDTVFAYRGGAARRAAETIREWVQ